MIVARVAVSPRFAETHSARASRHAAGSVRIDDVLSRAPSGRAPRTTRWRATHASSSLSTNDERKTTRDAELVRLPSGGAVAPWWAHGSDLANVADVRSPEEYAARMEEAKAMSLSRARPVVVCVEFFAGWCFACRALHPKMTKIASEEFADVLFLRVRKDECPALCDAMGIEKLPYVRIVSCFENRAARADAFTVNLTAPKLRKLRAALATHARGLGGGERRKPVAWREEE